MSKPGKKICKKAGFTPHQFHSPFVSFLCNEAERLRLPAFVKKNSTSGIGEGFTLVELLVTIFLVSVGLVGVLSFFNSSLQSNFEAKNELIAAGLAQEGTELVRNIIDYNYLNGDDWWKNVCKKNCKADKTDNQCKAIDYTSLSDHNCENKVAICLDSSIERYYECPNMGHSNETDYSRDIDVYGVDMNGGGIDLDAGDCLNVTVKVTWNDRTTTATDVICKPRQ
ncbi:MAG: type II secretion system protein [Patescibacteria group bacterium]|nr:type II secretion system protein [Patescibacteria group bacterium]